MKDSFHEELVSIFDQFPKYDVKILLGYFREKVFSDQQLGMRVSMKLVMSRNTCHVKKPEC